LGYVAWKIVAEMAYYRSDRMVHVNHLYCVGKNAETDKGTEIKYNIPIDP